MQQLGTTDANTCAYNDLALVKVDAADAGKVNPSVPFWGGPTGIDTDGTAAGDRVYTYGNSSLRAGVEPLKPHTGVSLGDDAADGGWSHPLYTVTPGIPGDSGSGFLSADGKALGVLSTLGLAPLAGVEQHRRPGQGAGLRAGALRASPGCSWSTAPSRSRRSSDRTRRTTRTGLTVGEAGSVCLDPVGVPRAGRRALRGAGHTLSR